MAIAIDRATYAVAPRIGVASGATILEQLVDVAKDDGSSLIDASVQKLRNVLARARASSVEDVRAEATSHAAGDLAVDLVADRCIKAIKLRLEAWPLLGDDDEARHAAELLALLYPSGLRFTKATFAVQDAEMRRMLTEIRDPAHADSMIELVGARFIEAFEAAAATYADMVKAMGRAVDPNVDQRSVVVALQTAIVQHASRVLGELDDDDPESVTRVQGLLAPIDNFRARASSNSGGATDNEADDSTSASDEASEP